MTVCLPDSAPTGTTCFGHDIIDRETVHRLVLPRLATFSEEDLFYNQASPHSSTGYKSVYEFIGEGNGQMSMLLLETFFFCKCIAPVAISNIHKVIPRREQNVAIVYAGASPGDHIIHLVEWFKEFEFHLYDEEGTMEKLSYLEEFTSGRVKLHMKLLTSEEATNLKNTSLQGKQIYFISDIRNKTYNTDERDEQSSEPRLSKEENNSSILDRDMALQLEIAQSLQPKYALMRYRPKLEKERITYSKVLTSDNDTSEIRKLYFNYPAGYFLKIPLPKRDGNSMFIITNSYIPTKQYFHDDMLSMIKHHNFNVRRINTYINPFTNTYHAFFGREIMKRFLPADKDIDNDTLDSYSTSLKWNHRAMIYIISLYIRYSGEKIDEAKIAEKIYKTLFSMSMNMNINTNVDVLSAPATTA
jgi:hypothetical protein